MEMIDRYIYAVTQRLPQSQQKDIEMELRGLIEDMLAERVQGEGATEKDVEEVLLELGNPRELARNYRGSKKYFIGPELYDPFMLVVKITLISTALSIFIVFIVQSIINPVAILDHFVGFIVSLVTILPAAFGWTAFGFGIAEYMEKINPKDVEFNKQWHPAKLAPVPNKKGRIKQHEPIVGIAFLAILIVAFMFSSEYLGIWVFDDGFSGVVPFLNTETFDFQLILIIIYLGIGIIKEALKLVFGEWTSKLATFILLLNLVQLAAVMLMITGLDFWNPNFMLELTQAGLLNEGSDAYQTVSSIWENSTLCIFILMVIGLIWELVEGFIKVNKSK
ncbi:hypothetical protein MUN88_08085 [Gracilibacillus caseinilyticus]|uniref:DUF1700 domain-containing protein n=1 Tax=Gracilibacillus caseinilyticus TaxID=2932256 RepID=A0ABY4F2B3_9BACI|nr:hypothetical protein [Gracilibacillus caseinilyticus]UOQ50009.1 hypothetical protein MUN88_08085 [Gracilibacillus caseinilyticus]